MQNILNISEAAAIGLHAADYLACRPGLASAKDIARNLGISHNHLLKVLQLLTHADLVMPVRGPKGGFTLSPSGKKATVRAYLSAIDGPPELHTCMMKAKVCRHRDCMLGRFLTETNKRFEVVLNGKISELSKRK
jgi:Rrf2 family protein